MVRPFFIAACVALLAGCATLQRSQPFATYQDIGIRLGGTVEGVVDLDQQCLTIEPVLDGMVQPPVFLIMPLGTIIDGEMLILPAENGGARITMGSAARFQGGYTTINEGLTGVRNPGNCRGDAFIVNSTYP